jgi:type I restriction enzyme S subunit
MDSIVINQRKGMREETARAKALRQAVLKAAFDGRLVSQDATDEPASSLLQRIVAERTDSNIAAQKRGRKQKSA